MHLINQRYCLLIMHLKVVELAVSMDFYFQSSIYGYSNQTDNYHLLVNLILTNYSFFELRQPCFRNIKMLKVSAAIKDHISLEDKSK